MSQTSYSEQAPLAFAGMLADPNSDMHIRSLANEDAALAKFGLGYAQGTDPEKQFEAFAAADTFAGVLVHRHQTEQRAQFGAGGTLGTTGLQEGETGDILTKGRVWVETNELVVAGEAAFVVNAVADFGKFRNDATNAQAVNGVFRQVASASLALLELNEP
jgi:hypothetical protein